VCRIKEQQELQLFKICYQWVEEEYQETLLGKDVSQEDFEKT
jgi:hypothetical protein